MDRYYAKLISNDLVEVKPMNKPSGTLYYIDKDLSKERREKINKIREKWKKK